MRCKLLRDEDTNTKYDRSTKYFHLLGSMKRHKKIIGKIIVDREEVCERGEIKKAFLKYFK